MKVEGARSRLALSSDDSAPVVNSESCRVGLIREFDLEASISALQEPVDDSVADYQFLIIDRKRICISDIGAGVVIYMKCVKSCGSNFR